MGLTRCLHLQQEIKHLLMLGEPFLRGQLKGAFDEGHIEAGVMRRAPGRAGLGRQGISAIHLRQCGFINHKNNLTSP